jgi:uncharacterized repeat protein (TIGR01451 family)
MKNFYIRIASLIVAIVISLNLEAQNTWSSIPNFPGLPRAGAASFSIGNYGYVGCGQHGPTNTNPDLSSDIWKWNIVDSNWSYVDSFPGGNRYWPVAFAIGSKFYMGLGWNGAGCSNDFWMYDTGTKVWTAEATFPGTPRCEPFCFVIGHSAYIGCGTIGTSPYLNDIWQYNADSNKWTQKNNFPGPNTNRTGTVGFALGSFGYAGSGGQYGLYNDCWKYNPTNDTWLQITNFPGATRSHAVTFVVNGTPFFGSGLNVSGAPLTDFWAFDTTSQTWSSIDSLPSKGRWMATGFSINNSYGFVGTGNNDASTYYSDMWKLTPSPANNQIGGIVYVDKNANCIYDSGTDVPVVNITMKAVHNGNIAAIAVTNFLGKYSFDYLNSSYNYKIEMDSASSSAYSATCPASGIIDTVPTATNINFAVQCNKGFDLTGILAACIDTPFIGESEISACIYNTRCMSVNGSMKLVIDTSFKVYFILSDSTPTVSGDTLTWNFNNMGPEGNQYLCVSLKGTVNLPPNDSIQISLIATPIAGDSVPSNNIITYWVHVFPHNCIGVPFDPNEKSVSPVGNITPSQRLTYAIQFQNTGTAVAHNVVVIDTLSPYLDPATLQIINSSAPMTTEIIAGHILKFTFNNISLPDTATSKIASIGDLTYSILPLSTVPDGIDIKNTADIYFDANPAVITNTTHSPVGNVVTSVVSNSLQNGNITCFPNPSSNKVTILYSLNQSANVSISVYDMLGDKIKDLVNDSKVAGTYNVEWMPNGISPGVYLLRYVVNGEAKVQKLIITQ